MQATANNLSTRIKQEQIRILHSHHIEIFGSTCAIILVTTLALWPVVNKPLLMIWTAVACLTVAVRFLVCQRYSSLSTEQQNLDYKKWANRFAIGSFSNAVIWGLVPTLLYPGLTMHFALLICIHSGYISGSSSMTAIYLPTCLIFVITSTLLFSAGILISGGPDYWAYALLLCLFGVATAISARRNNLSVAEQITLRLQNIELMNDLTLQRDNAEKAMLAKNRFLAAASHDLRQPVHALGLFVDSLAPYLEAPKAKKILEKIRQSSAALGGLFHGLLDISKLDADVIENNPRDFLLDDLLTRLRNECTKYAEAKHLTLNIPANCNHAIFADPALLERIVRNIVSNAIKYTDHGSITLSYSHEPNGYINLNVTDTGKGIPEAELDNIFSEYHQLENSERDREKGLGLGLAIVRRLGLLTGVEIKVSSTLNIGSVFTIKVPEGDISKIAPPAPAPKLTRLEDMRIVVIDDEADIIEGMQNVLTSWGCTTFTGTSTAEAMSTLQNEAMPDLIIADFRLKAGESGLDAIQMIRDEYNYDIPAALITGDTSPERLRQAVSASAVLMHKPVEPEKLRNLLTEINTQPAMAEAQ